MASIWHWFEYVAVVGQMPWLDRIWVKNPMISKLRPAKWSPMVRFAMKQQEQREVARAEGKQLNERDFLGRFIKAMEKDPSLPAWSVSIIPSQTFTWDKMSTKNLQGASSLDFI